VQTQMTSISSACITEVLTQQKNKLETFISFHI